MQVCFLIAGLFYRPFYNIVSTLEKNYLSPAKTIIVDIVT